jgi:ABC-type bacteriocin/lantibiotic exporter with double-glycine peptidase domain
MDEPTSALDLNNANQIIKNIINLNKDVTLIVVTHHKSILKSFNKSFNIKNSKLVIKNI